MEFRKLSLSLAAMAAISPVISHASPENAALRACANAFASRIAAPGAAAPTVKLDTLSDEYAGGFTDYSARKYTFYLKARNAKTGLPVARATCTSDASGTVTDLTAALLPKDQAVLASAN